jgi:hypothetical protein
MGRYQMSERKLPKYEPAEHASDCAIYNGPAYKPQPCNCGVVKAPAANDHKPYNPEKEAMLDEVSPDFDARRDVLAEKARAYRDERAKEKVEEAPAEKQPPTDPSFWIVTLLDEREKGLIHPDGAAANTAAIEMAAQHPGRTVIVMKVVAAYSTPRPHVSSVSLSRVLAGIDATG